MNGSQKHPNAPIDAGIQYAGFWRRFAAACIDMVVYTPLYFVCGYLPRHPFWLPDTVFMLLALVTYAMFFAAKRQGSPGMWIMKFKVVTAEGHGRISFARALWWGFTSAAGWMFAAAGLFYLMSKYDLQTINACVHSADMTIKDGVMSCGKYTDSAAAAFGPGGYREYLLWAMIALGCFFVLSFVWSLSIGLSKEKAGFHNLFCHTRFVMDSAE